MPSSTSSSEPSRGELSHCAAARLPDLPWRRQTALALLLALVLCGVWEVGLWQWGVTPSLRNEPALWAREVRRLRAHKPATPAVVLLGSSRVQNGVDPALLSQQLDDVAIYNLSISGTDSLHALTYLADETTFAGDVVVELWPMRQLAVVPGSSEKIDVFIRYAREETVAQRFGAWLSMGLDARLRLFHFMLNTVSASKTFAARRHLMFPLESYDQRRFAPLAYDRITRARHEELQGALMPSLRRSEPLAPDALAERVAAFATPIATLRQRGARVLFFHPRLSGAVEAIERERMPRAAYWEPFLAALGAPGLHHEDDAALRVITCPDGAHINHDQVPTQTSALASALRAMP